MRNWNWEINQLAAGNLDVARAVVPFDDWCMASVTTDRTALHRVRLAAGWLAALLPAPESGAVFIDGRRVNAGDAVLLPPAVEVDVLTHGVGQLFVFACRDNTLMFAMRNRGSCRALRVGTAVRLYDDLRESLAAPAPVLADPQLAASLHARVHAWLRTAVACPKDSGADGDEVPRRRMAVERARRFIHEHLAEPIRLPELCRHAHLQARSLEYGFRDLVGMSPIRYVKMLRLGEVRRRLQTSGAGERSVSEVALDCGFCHLSQFAVDYKKVFMESPSETRRAADSAWPARLRTRRASRELGPAAFAV
jgi:AraC family ethanolamine operon transcriptional activator